MTFFTTRAASVIRCDSSRPIFKMGLGNRPVKVLLSIVTYKYKRRVKATSGVRTKERTNFWAGLNPREMLINRLMDVGGGERTLQLVQRAKQRGVQGACPLVSEQ